MSTVHIIYVEPIALQGWWKVSLCPSLTRYMFWHSLRHTIWKYLWQIYSDILSDIFSGIVSDVYSAILFVRVQARSTASWARDMAVGSRHPDLAAWHSGRAALHCIHSRRGRREGEEGEEGEEEEEGVAPLLKSRNLHLAGGEKELKIEVLFCFQTYCFVEVWGCKKLT